MKVATENELKCSECCCFFCRHRSGDNCVCDCVCSSFTSSLGVGYLMVCTSNYPNVLAFCFLDELQKEFLVTYDRKRISSALRPYSFIEFGEFVPGQRSRRSSHRNTQDS